MKTIKINNVFLFISIDDITSSTTANLGKITKDKSQKANNFQFINNQ